MDADRPPHADVVRWRRLRPGMAVLGVLAVHLIVTVQSFAVLAAGHGRAQRGEIN